MSAPPRLLVLRCPSWPTVALGGASRALAVVERGRVVAATPVAVAAGVRVGQRRREATWNCPLLEIAPRDEGAERRGFLPVLERLERFGAAVTVRRPGWVWVPTRGPARYFGGEAQLAAGVAAALRELGEPWAGGEGLIGGCFGVGIGDGIFAATRAAARGLVVASTETPTFLAPLPVELLGRDLAELLRNLGITTLGEFAALDEDDVLARFGWDGAAAHRTARGAERVAQLTAHARDVDGEAAIELDPPAALVDEVVLAARRLAGELCERVTVAGFAFSLLSVTVETEGGDVTARRWSHDGPFTAALVIERVRWQLEGWMAPPERDEASQLVGGVVLLRLTAEEIVPEQGRQGGLWERTGASDHHVVQAFARVQGMLGPDGVLQGALVGGRDPRDRIALHPFGDRPPGTPRPLERPWPGRIPPPSPSLVFATPVPVALTDAAGRPLTVSGRGELSAPPAVIEVAGEAREVTAWAGPWPLDERWWEPSRRRRARLQVVAGEEVYSVATEQGAFVLEGRYD